MGERVTVNLEACKSCTVGSCCYEGTELSAEEVRRIVEFNPPVAKPWFRLVERHEDPDGHHAFSTITRNGSCVFHDKSNRCMIYPVRPRFCQHFPLENEEAAPHYKRLCVLFKDHWGPNSSVRKILVQRENGRKKN